MEPSLLDDEEALRLYAKAKHFIHEGDYAKALEVLEDLIFVHKEDDEAMFLHAEQGQVFRKLAEREKNPEGVAFTYMLASVGCLSEDDRLFRICAQGLLDLGQYIGSVMYYKKCLKKAKLASCFSDSESLESVQHLESIVKVAETKIAGGKSFCVRNCEPEVLESEKRADPVMKGIEELRSYWMGLDVKIKRDFMRVSIDELRIFVKGTFNREGLNALEEVLASAKKDKKWTSWMCPSLCAEKFSSAEECKNHLEQVHAADFVPSLEKDRVKRIGKDWARKISVGDWKPVDAEVAVEMIKNRLEYGKASASKCKNGWSENWPLAVDEERSKLLQEIKSLLVSFCDLKILPCCIRDWVMYFPVKHLEKLHVTEQSIYDLRIVETPQSICFLERRELKKILDFLNNIKCKRNDGTDLVCKAVDSIVDRTRVREKIDFDYQFSLLLLDRRLLKSRNAPFDDDVTINECDPNAHYAKASAQGDDIISWLVDYSSVDKIFPRPIKEHNIDIWVAVMKAVQFTSRTLGDKYAKKRQVLDYDAALTDVKNLCKRELKRSYACLLCDECEQRVMFTEMDRNTISRTKVFLCVAQDVLKGASDPTFDFPGIKNCMDPMYERLGLSDDLVLNSIGLLKSVVTRKVLLIDSKILLIDNSRITLLNNLIRLSVFDNRTYMLRMLKPFMLNEIQMMESKAKSDAAEAELLLEEKMSSQSKEKISLSKKKKNKRNKRTSTRMPRVSSPLDKTVEQAPSPVKFEPEATSPSLKVLEEESTEAEDTLAIERSRLEISSNPDNQEETTEVDPGMQNLALGGAAIKYYSVLDMTLKALLNINHLKEDLKHNEQPSYEDHEEQVTCALQKLFNAFKSEVLEEVYSVLLSDLLASLKEDIYMSGNAVKVLATILKFWPPWKNRDIQNLVDSLFLLEENERISCRKCRRDPNYSEQRSYCIVIAADSIRDLKCAFGNMKFVDILKLIRMENKMLCDIKLGGCGEANFVHYVINRIPPIFTVVLEWEESETGEEISETTKALELEINISGIYEGLIPNINYRLVSMVCCGEEDEHICLAYRNNWGWVNLLRGSFAEEDVGNWESVIKFCEERKVHPEILFYESCMGPPLA